MKTPKPKRAKPWPVAWAVIETIPIGKRYIFEFAETRLEARRRALELAHAWPGHTYSVVRYIAAP